MAYRRDLGGVEMDCPMKIGTRSVLYGYHQFLIHPLFVALGWWKLHGFPWDPRLWVAFLVHDLGYIGKPNMDGNEGEYHPMTGAKIMGALFDYRDRWLHRRVLAPWYTKFIAAPCDFVFGHCPLDTTWFCLVFYHSRFLSKKYGAKPSQLCHADKLAIVITPTWLQLLLMNASGEIHEYMQLGDRERTPGEGKTQRQWVEAMKRHIRGWLSDEFETCIACGADVSKAALMCDEQINGKWCIDCFEKTPCGKGEHEEGCRTLVMEGPA